MSKPNIVVLMGGPDAERDVSISSGTAVAAALVRLGRDDSRKKHADSK